MSSLNSRNLVTVKELASQMKVHENTVRRWYHSNEITNYGKGKILKFDLNEVLKLSA